MIIVTPRNDEWIAFYNITCGKIFLNGNQDYCIRIPTVEDVEESGCLYNTVNLENGGLCYTDEDAYVLPLPKSELHIKF